MKRTTMYRLRPLLLLLAQSRSATVTTSAFALLRESSRSAATTKLAHNYKPVAAGTRRKMMAAALSFSRQRPSSLLVEDARRSSSRTASTNRKGLPALQQTAGEKGPAETPSTASSSTSTALIAVVGTSLLALCIGGAYTGILPGYTAGTDGAVVDPSLIVHDVGMTVLAAVLGYAFVKINTLAVRAGVLDPRDARKVIHTGAAPLFILFWPGFETRFFAAIIPILNALRLFLAARDADSELAAAVSRSGDIKEAVGGPFVYVIMMIACLLIYWTSSPVGVVALCTLAAGDGLADLVGRRWGKSNQWPGLPGNKSVVGSLAFWSASTALSYGILSWLQYNHCLTLNNVDQLLFRLAAVTLVAAVVELIPNLDDNYTVPISAAAVAAVLLQ